MKMVVCCKAVPGVVTDVRVAGGATALEYQGQYLSLNEYDDYALEEALALKRAVGGEVTVITLGPITAQDILYGALAKGADRAVRIDARLSHPEAVSIVLAEAIRRTEYDLVLTGVQATDTLAAQVGVSLAERLGLPFAFAVVQVVVTQEGIRITKELGGGRRALVEMSLPALLCIQTGIQPLSYAPPARILRARQQPLRSLSLSDLGLAEDQLQPEGGFRILEVYPPQKTRQAELVA